MLAYLPANSQTVSPYSCRDTPAYELARIRSKDLTTSISREFETVGIVFHDQGDSAGGIRCLNEAAKLWIGISEFEAAERALHKAIEIAGQTGVQEHIASTLSTLFFAAYQKGEVKKVRALQVDLLKVLPLVTANKAAVLYSLGLFEYSFGNVGKARDYFRQAEPIVPLTEDPRIICQVLIYSGYSALREDDPFTTLEKAETALSIAQQYDYAKGRSNANFALAYTRIVTGDNQVALELLTAAEADLFPDSDLLERAIIVNAKASLYVDFGRHDLARPALEEAISYYESLKNPRGRMSSMLSMADIEFELGNTEKALQLYNEVSGNAASLDDKFQLGVISERIGDVAFSTGNLTVALEKYKAAMSAYKNKGVRLARVENSLANVYELMGDLSHAQGLLESARIANERNRSPMELARNYFDLARLAVMRGDAKLAESHILESIKITDQFRSSIDSSSLRTSYFAKVTERFELYISLLMSGKLGPDRHVDLTNALAIVERSRARTLRDMVALAGSNLRRDASQQIVDREKELLTVLNLKKLRLTDLLVDAASSAEVEAAEREIVKLEEELVNVRLEIKRESPIYHEIISPQNFDLADFQSNILKDNEMLLEFSLGEKQSYLWAVSQGEITAYDLPQRSVIEARVDRLRSLIASRELDPGESLDSYQERLATAEREYAVEAQSLSNELFGQVFSQFAATKLIIVADGRLHHFPVGALPVPSSDSDEPILSKNELVYVPSASALKILRMEQKTERMPSRDVLVFADPVFSGTDERLAGRENIDEGLVATLASPFRGVDTLARLRRLPASEEEARSISDVVGASRATVISGFAANRDAVLNRDIEDYKVVHFATHGLIDEKRPELSGILLSMFKETGRQPDGGFIRMQDVFGMRLKSDLVVLSACDTGVGKEVKGEGVMSLNTAFLQAGAKSVVSSLWKVDDVATKELMTEFYRGIAQDGLSTAAALRQAQIKISGDPRYRSPFYWAAFTVTGDDRTKIEFLSNGHHYGPAAAIVLSAIFVLLVIRSCRRRRLAEH